MLIYLSVTPDALARASAYHRRFAHVAYRIGEESRLLRQNLLLKTRGGLMSLSDRDAPAITRPERLCREILQECRSRGYSGVAADFEEAPSGDRRAFLAALYPLLLRERMTLYLPEAYGPAVPGAVVIICTALSGGQYRQRVQEALDRYGRVALDVERLSMDFLVPAPTGEGQPLTPEQLEALRRERQPTVFFSDELCARYFTYTQGGTGHFVLFDDAETLRRKIRLGRALGCEAAFLMFPEVEDLLPVLFSGKEN